MSDLLKRLQKNSVVKPQLLKNSKYFDNGEVVPTSTPLLNLALRGTFKGGLTSGITMIAAPPKHFKTNFMLDLMKTFQDHFVKEDAVCILYDSEKGYSKDYFVKAGIDMERVDHRFITSVEQLKTDMANLVTDVKEGEKVFIAIDSLGMLPSLKEVTDALNSKESVDMTRAKQIKSLIRIVMPHIALKDIYVVILNHSYKTLELYAKDVASGGNAAQYAGHTLWFISKAQEKEGDELAGYRFTIKAALSRYVKEQSTFPIVAIYGEGIKKYSGIFDLAFDAGFIKDWTDPEETPDEKKARLAIEKAEKKAAKDSKGKKKYSGALKTYEWLGEEYSQNDMENDPIIMEALLANPAFCDAVECKYKL